MANGVQVEAYSVEDNGKGIQFNVYFYNVQPGVKIYYENGKNVLADKTLTANDILPFATINPTDKNPDLMYEINKQLDILFADQKESSEYNSMMNQLQSVADNARMKGNAGGVKEYQEAKKIQYEYVETLSEYVPKLLENEKFFNDILK